MEVRTRLKLFLVRGMMKVHKPPSTFTFSQINHHVLKKTPPNPETWISYEADIIATFS